MFYTYTHVFVYFLLFPKLDSTCVTVSIDLIYPYSYCTPLIPSVSPLGDLCIHQHTVLMPTLGMQTSKLYNDVHL